MINEPITLAPEAYYDDWAISEILTLPLGTIAAARRSGALRSTRRGQRNFYRGSWILEWLEAGAAPPPKACQKTGGEEVVR
jgi:hypothetical protein